MSEQTLRAYQALRFNEDAGRHTIVVPVGYVTWDDEYPGDKPVPMGDSDAYKSIAALHAARWHYWMQESIPDEFSQIWEEAQQLIPDWPGFQRLYVDEETKQLARDCRESENEIWEALMADADEVEYEDDGTGIGS